MTTLEIILIAIIWIGYGVLCGYQTEVDHKHELKFHYFMSILFAPILLLVRLFIGIFHSKIWN